MPEPLRSLDASEGPLADAAARLERALERLEAAMKAQPLPPTEPPPAMPGLQAANDALAGELAASRRRGEKLQAAAADAAEAVDRAAAEVRKVLEADAAVQGLLDFTLEAEAGPGEEPHGDGPSTDAPAAEAEEEPTA